MLSGLPTIVNKLLKDSSAVFRRHFDDTYVHNKCFDDQRLRYLRVGGDSIGVEIMWSKPNLVKRDLIVSQSSARVIECSSVNTQFPQHWQKFYLQNGDVVL